MHASVSVTQSSRPIEERFVVHWCSDVAALLGRHPYKSRELTLLQTLARQKDGFEKVLEEIRSDRELQLLLANQHDKVTTRHCEGVSAAKPDRICEQLHGESKKLPLELETGRRLKDEGDNVSASTERCQLGERNLPLRNAEFREACSDVKSRAPVPTTEDVTYHPRGRTQRSRTFLQCGKDMEEAVLDATARRHGVEIVDRNTELRCFRGRNYELRGRIDGRIRESGTITEVKTRRRWWFRPPYYDLLQLKLYLKLFDERRGLLVEQMRDSELVRETELEHDEEEWREIDSSLSTASDLILGLSTLEDVRRLVLPQF
jgi:hypothetical protein